MKRMSLGLCVAGVFLILGACQTVERTFTGKPRLARPVEVVYRFDNVKRTPSVNEWDRIRRVLYLHAKGSVDITESNLRRYDQADLRDYVARFAVADASIITKINEEVDALSDSKVGGQTMRFGMNKAEIAFVGDNLTTPNDIILRGVTTPAATVKIFPTNVPIETTADQYGAWAKRLSVSPGQDQVYGYSESFAAAGKPAVRKYFKVNVFTMAQQEVTAAQFEARPKR